jgi:cysteinyl-tRNA synthetase
MIIRLALMLHHWQDDWEYDSDNIEQATKIYLTLSQNLGTKYMSKADLDIIVNLCLNNLDIPKVISFLLELKPLAHSDDGFAIDSVLQSLLGLKLGSAI